MYDLRTYYQRKMEREQPPWYYPFTDTEGVIVKTEDGIASIIAARKQAVQMVNAESQHLIENTLVNRENYGPFVDTANGMMPSINVRDITTDNWEWYYNSCLNIMKDGIYTEFVQRAKVRIYFGLPEYGCNLTYPDLFFNLIMWRLMIFNNVVLQPCHIFFLEELRAKSIKEYIDLYDVEVNRMRGNTIAQNRTIADTLFYYHDVDLFANFLCNTLNLEDTADLMMLNEKFYDVMTHSYSGMQADQVKEAIMRDTYDSIDMIKQATPILGRDHCLIDIWRANEGINPKQYAEFTIGIGIKPNGVGGIFPEIVDTSFIGGGLLDPVHYFIESSTSRIAQIEKFKQVSKSGTLARIMGLNNMDSRLHDNPYFDCGTKNLIPIHVRSEEFLRHLNMRYYREFQDGQEKCINYRRDKHLIGKTILIRSPITCATHAMGHGICYKCYGNLAYTVYDHENHFGINIGRIAAEYISSKQTQKQLSVKHLLEAFVSKIEWSENFFDFFDVDNTIIYIGAELEEPTEYRLLIHRDDIEVDSEFDVDEDDGESIFSDAIEFVTRFRVVHKSSGTAYDLTTKSGEKLIITKELNHVINKRVNGMVPTDDGYISIPFTALINMPLFDIKVQNNEISKVLNQLKNLFNRSNEVRGQTIPNLLQQLLDTNIEGSMDVAAIHYEVILSNQVRRPDDVLERPDWLVTNASYRILTLDEALMKNPAALISLSYQKITKQFYDPLTFRKKGASFIDLFFMPKPQLLLHDAAEPPKEPERKPGEYYEPIKIIADVTSVTVEDPTYESETGLIDVEE